VKENDRDTFELSTDQWTNIIEKLPVLEMGIITGGEPLLRKDIFTIIRKLSTKVENLVMLTSAQVMTDKIASEITDTGVALQVQISEVGAKYDESTGARGAFEKLERSIINLNKHDIPFTTSIVLSNSNRENLENILSFHLAAGSSHLLAIRYIPQVGQKDFKGKVLAIEIYRDLLKRLNRFSKKNNFPISLGIPNLPCVARKKDFNKINMPSCGAGVDYFAVDERGRLKICPHHIFNGPSLLDFSLEEALAGLSDAIVKNKKLPEQCIGCVDSENCGGGCRSGAFSLGGAGDPVGSPHWTSGDLSSKESGPDPLLWSPEG